MKKVYKDLYHIKKGLEEARAQMRMDLAKARNDLMIAAPELSESLGSLSVAAERLKEETGKLAESVDKNGKSDTKEAKNLMDRQEKLNQKIERVRDMLSSRAREETDSSINKGDMEGLRRAREADIARATLEKPPLDAKNALEESTVNEAAKDQVDSFNTATRNQEKLQQTLDKLAEHYREATDETRAWLAAREKELGLKEKHDKDYGDLKQVLEFANMSPAEQLRALEEKLKDNPIMQDELRNIAESTLEDAKKEMEAAAQKAQQMAQKGESGQQQQAGNDPKKGANEQDVKAAVEQARAMAEKEVPKIQKDAEQAKAEAKEDLKQAKESLQAAAEKGEQAMKDPSKSPEEKMQAMSNALNQAAKSLDQAAQKAGERAQAAKDPGQKAAAEKAQAAAKAAAQKAQQMAQKGESGQQQQAGNDPKKGGSGIGRGKTDPVEAYMWAYVAREHARKTPGQKSNAVKANIHLNRIKKELSAAELKAAEEKARAILSKL
ncbi:MAG: hypothetical protein QF406_06510 [Verrucomicrobiota bacterium]|nr:hypothetical protein [Verrucomicrobiota bacterium]